MASYQDLETRLAVIEDKVAFILDSFTVTKRTYSALMPDQFTDEVRTLAQAYRDIKTGNMEVMRGAPD